MIIHGTVTQKILTFFPLFDTIKTKGESYDAKCLRRAQTMTIDEIEAILNQLGVENYSISDDGTVDVFGTVDISFKELTRIPVQFGNIKGDFNCSNNLLETLDGCPHTVGVSFFCHANKLTSLNSSPNSVGKAFICKSNRLKSLEGITDTINGIFDCSENLLTSLKGGPRSVNGNFDCSHNRLATLDGIPAYVKMVLYCNGNPIPRHVLTNYKQMSSFLVIGDDE